MTQISWVLAKFHTSNKIWWKSGTESHFSSTMWTEKYNYFERFKLIANMTHVDRVDDEENKLGKIEKMKKSTQREKETTVRQTKPNKMYSYRQWSVETESKLQLTFISDSVTVSVARFVGFIAVCEVRNLNTLKKELKIVVRFNVWLEDFGKIQIFSVHSH